MMRKTVRYQINACVRTCRIQRSNPDGVFFIRRGIDNAEDGALSRTHKKISRLLATQSAYLFEILRCKIVLKIHGKLINQDSACCADDQDP